MRHEQGYFEETRLGNLTTLSSCGGFTRSRARTAGCSSGPSGW